MDWQMLATLIGMVAAIIGGIWAIETKFEKKLGKRLTETETRLQSGITENRQLIIKYIAKE